MLTWDYSASWLLLKSAWVSLKDNSDFLIPPLFCLFIYTLMALSIYTLYSPIHNKLSANPFSFYVILLVFIYLGTVLLMFSRMVMMRCLQMRIQGQDYSLREAMEDVWQERLSIFIWFFVCMKMRISLQSKNSWPYVSVKDAYAYRFKMGPVAQWHFVLPIITIENTNIQEALRRNKEMVGQMEFMPVNIDIFFLLGCIAAIGLQFLISCPDLIFYFSSPMVMVLLLLLLIFYILIFVPLNVIVKTVLYLFKTKKMCPASFDPNVLSAVFSEAD